MKWNSLLIRFFFKQSSYFRLEIGFTRFLTFDLTRLVKTTNYILVGEGLQENVTQMQSERSKSWIPFRISNYKFKLLSFVSMQTKPSSELGAESLINTGKISTNLYIQEFKEQQIRKLI